MIVNMVQGLDQGFPYNELKCQALETCKQVLKHVGWQAVKRRGALKEKILALTKVEGPLTEG